MDMQTAVAPLLDSIAQLTAQAEALDADLASDPRYAQLSIIRANIDSCEERIKEELKGSGIAAITIQSSGYEAELKTRHNKGTVVYNVPAIEAQPWGAGCIVKAVNEKVFKAIVEAMSLDITQFAKVEPGTTTLAVSIHKVEDKQP
jgi:hypothetical protein